jgi:hypothetical protein
LKKTNQPRDWALMALIFVVLLAIFGFVLRANRAVDLELIGLGLGIAVQGSFAVLVYVMKLFVRLGSEGLHVRFFPFVKKDIPLEDIARWEARTYRPLLEYGGWGIRCGWKGMAYNVSGNQGVQLQFTNGKRPSDRLASPGRTGGGDQPGEAARQLICRFWAAATGR